MILMHCAGHGRDSAGSQHQRYKTVHLAILCDTCESLCDIDALCRASKRFSWFSAAEIQDCASSYIV